MVGPLCIIKEKGKITNKDYRNIAEVSDRTALSDLRDLCNRDLLIKIGKTGRDTKYILKKIKPEINPKKNTLFKGIHKLVLSKTRQLDP